MAGWNLDKAMDLYKIAQWSSGYFTINSAGNLCVRPAAESPCKVDLKRLMDELGKRKINPPILIRFMDILKDRIAKISDCFVSAIKDNEYKAPYYPLFPIKVNQERDVVAAILKYGAPYGLGLEAGSKAELLIVMALTLDPNTPIVCNGYKDQEFVELVGMAHKMGKKIIPVIENFEEIQTFIAHYRKTGIMPNLGLRIKLSTKGIGQWARTGGDNSKFGLRMPEVMKAVEALRGAGQLQALKMVHFHVGSQITKIGAVKQATVETSRVYVELCKLGAPMEYLDIGGGLSVDYAGSRSDTIDSINYGLEEYANDIVYRIKSICDENGFPHPTIFSESGRFLAAHYSILITNVAATSSLLGDTTQVPTITDNKGPVKEMREILENMHHDNLVECYHDAIQYKNESLNLFSLGYMTLPQRAAMEELFWTIMRKIHNHSQEAGIKSLELEDLEHQLADTYFANFSVFQSMPDSWAINQTFPVIPVHRLHEPPTHQGVIVDLTCDSDGIVENYVGQHEKNASLPLHGVHNGDPYYVGFFLLGAYQETLGELHNLFGDTHAVQIEISGENRYKIRKVNKGDSIHKVIGYLSYDSKDLLSKMREQIETALENQRLTLEDSAQLMDLYEDGLHGYTYFED